MIRFVDTFAGIGGFRMAAEAAAKEAGERLECVLSVELDDQARATYEANHGEEPAVDMTRIDPRGIPDHDLLMGGFPCQPFSRNGRYYNKNSRTLGDDDRKNLALTLMGVLRAKQPRFFVLENVKEIRSILNADGSSFFDTLMANLEDCGYDVACEVLDTKDFGIPQQRRRAYFVGTRKDLGLRYVFPRGRPLRSCVGDLMDDCAPARYLLERLWGSRRFGARDGRPVSWIIRAMRERGLKKRFVDLLEREHGWCNDPPLRLDVLRLAIECGEWEPPPGKVSRIWPLGIIYGDTPSLLPRQQDKLYSRLGVSPTIATFSAPAFDHPRGWRVLTPRECLRMQGFPDSFAAHEKDAVAYRQAGNAVTVVVAQAVLSRLLRVASGWEPKEAAPAIRWE